MSVKAEIPSAPKSGLRVEDLTAEVPSLPFLLRVDRTPDWGFSLTPVPAEGPAVATISLVFARNSAAQVF